MGIKGRPQSSSAQKEFSAPGSKMPLGQGGWKGGIEKERGEGEKDAQSHDSHVSVSIKDGVQSKSA